MKDKYYAIYLINFENEGKTLEIEEHKILSEAKKSISNGKSLCKSKNDTFKYIIIKGKIIHRSRRDLLVL